jgi:hypothetical protein
LRMYLEKTSLGLEEQELGIAIGIKVSPVTGHEGPEGE